MKTNLELKEITNGFTNRDHGLRAVRNLKKELYDEWIRLSNLEATPNLPAIFLIIPNDLDITASFIDEFIYRLSNEDMLHLITFVTDDERFIHKLQSVSNNRGLNLKVKRKDKEFEIEPSGEVIAEPEVIIEDL